ncbi:MAG: SEL1-like repeat protein [Verrucomicrobiota bacterium]
MELTQWIRSQAATGQPLNIHAVQRERPDLLEQAFAGPAPRGWRRSLIDAGVDPYEIVHEFGKGVAKSEATAVNWYRKAADEGDVEAKQALEKLDATKSLP